MDLNSSEIAFLNDLARSKLSWTNAAAHALADPGNTIWTERTEAWKTLAERLPDAASRDAFLVVVNELLSGFAHSTLVSFDGGTELAETTGLSIQDDDGYEFKKCLHEFWPEFSEEGVP